MKKTLLFSLLTLMGLTMMASPVDTDKAMQVAKNFMTQYVKNADQLEAMVVYTHPMPKSGQPAMYVVNIGSAFAIVSADDVAHPVLGYSLSHPWPTQAIRQSNTQTLPLQVASYLDDLAAQIEAAAGTRAASLRSSDSEIDSEWQQLTAEFSIFNSQFSIPDSVGPLLTTTWDQEQYYNALCPEDAAGPAGHAVTGCVATAMAQIINYWGYPAHGFGTHSYYCYYGNVAADFDSSNYDYTHMPSALTSSSTQQEINAVATLMRDCGIANDMLFGSASSGALYKNIRGAFISHFAYSSNLGFADRTMYADDEWIALLRREIDSGAPVYYSGQNGIVSHAFVLDGYKEDGYFHFNFGWSGYSDGWYLTSAINPSWEFNYWQQAIVGIRPDSTERAVLCNFIPVIDLSSATYLETQESFTVSSPVHLYNISGKNEYQMNYNNYGEAKPILLHFVPSDSAGQLVLDVFNIDIGHAVVVYDGPNMDSLIRVLEPAGEGYPYAQLPNDPAMQQCVTNDFSPIVSTKHGFTIKEYCSGMLEKEMHILVSDASACRMVSNVSETRDSAGYKISWTPNGSATQWQVAWADTLASCDTTFIAINSHFEDDNLEVKIRSVCGEGNYGEWNTVVLNPKKYWQDFVEEQPDGFFVSGDTVKISSAEGLAWWMRQCNTEDYPTANDRKTIEFLADIDMGAHLWKSVSYYGKVLGNGHTISNLKTGYYSAGNGLFRHYQDDTIFDLHMRNAEICGDGSIGSLCGGISYAVIMNCSSVDYRASSELGGIGGLVGGANHSRIINCYAIGENYAQAGHGGILNLNYDSYVSNCYTSQGTSFQWLSIQSDLYGPGLITGSDAGGSYDNCYADINNTERHWDPSVDSMATLYYFFGYVTGHGIQVESAINVATFRVDGDTIGRIIQDTSVNYNLGENMDLLTALNRKVVETNSSGLRTWVWDSVLHFPVLGGYYEPTCPNVSNIMASNIAFNDGTAVALSWNENGDAEQWQVKYVEEDASENDAVVYSVFAPNDTVENLMLGHTYYFSVRPICNEDDTVGWSQPVKLYVDKKYWTEIVTQCPAGYVEDDGGNVTISSAEGLAYLDYLNQWNSFEGRTVSIVNDIDMGAYRWKPLDYFLGTIEGNNHAISNIICRESMSDENSAYIGFLGNWCQCTIRDITIKNGVFSGRESVGGLFGQGYGGFFENCNIDNALVRGRYFVGGLGGVIPSMYNIETIIKNCSTSGVIFADQSAGGLIGSIQSNDAVINNCYSSCDIYSVGKMPMSLRGGLVGTSQGVISNCYSSGNVEYDSTNYYNSTGLSIGHISIDGEMHNVYARYADGIPFRGRANTWLVFDFVLSDTATFDNNGALNSSVTIGDSTYTDLLTALNAWVDANDTAGIYRHWAADSANVNGGFPVFAAIPCTPAAGSDSITVCDSYTWNGAIYTIDTILMDTLSTMDGCDSIVSHYLFVKYSTAEDTTAVACDSFTWYEYTDITESTDSHTHVFVGANTQGCDSTVTLHLTINYSTTGDTTATACDSFVWWNTNYTNSTDSAMHIYTNAAGCDSTVTLHLTIFNSQFSILTDTACEAYFWDGEWRYVSGQYADTNTNIVGCDSIVTLNLTINNPVNTATTVTACDSYTWHDAVITTSGTYHYTHTDANGCTQDDTLYLTINYSTIFNSQFSILTDTACEAYFWDGEWLYVSGQYADTNTNSVGCDSIVTLNLTINNPVNTATTVTACDSYTWHDAVITTSGTYHYTHTDANGCTQDDTLYLTINYSTTGDTTVTACDSFTWWNTNYTNSTDSATHVYTNAAGCDSTVTLHLTIFNSQFSILTDTACEAYFWDGEWLYVSGQYADTNTNSVGCDSIVTLNLTINNPVNTATTVTACVSYTWHDAVITTSGTYHYTHTDANGCTQDDTLYLTINYSTTGDTTVTACDSFTWWNTNYTNSTDSATHVYTNAAGCDSTVTLHLSIFNSQFSTLTDTAEGSYTWNGTTYTESGTYQWIGTTVNGCDSTVTLILTINQVGIFEVQNSEFKIDVYPNPTTGLLTIAADDVLSVEVFDQAGRRVMTFGQSASRGAFAPNIIDLTHLTSGAYILKINLQRGTSVQRVIVE